MLGAEGFKINFNILTSTLIYRTSSGGLFLYGVPTTILCECFFCPMRAA